jgi:hypothetical protein
MKVFSSQPEKCMGLMDTPFNNNCAFSERMQLWTKECGDSYPLFRATQCQIQLNTPGEAINKPIKEIAYCLGPKLNPRQNINMLLLDSLQLSDEIRYSLSAQYYPEAQTRVSPFFLLRMA